MAKDNDPIRLSPIALRMKEDLQLSGKGDRTQESYIRMLRKFTEFLKNEPDSATESDLRNYLLHITTVGEEAAITMINLIMKRKS